MSDDIDEGTRARLQKLARTIFLTLADEDWPAVVRLVEDEWAILATHRVGLLRTVAEALPDDFVAEHPRWSGLRRHLGYMLAGERIQPVGYPDGGPTAAAKTVLDALVDLTSHSIAARTDGRFEVAAQWAKDGLEWVLAADEERLASASGILATLSFQWGLSLLLDARMREAESAFEFCYSRATASGNARSAAESAGHLAWMHAAAGRGCAADQWIEKSIAMIRSGAQNSLRPGLQIAIASRQHDRLELQEAMATLDAVPSEGSHEHRAVLAAYRAEFAPCLDRDRALQTLSGLDAETAALPTQLIDSGVNAYLIAYARALVYGFGGQPERALSVFDDFVNRGVSLHFLARRASTRYLIGALPAAERDADSIISTALRVPRQLAQGLVVKAAVLLQRRETDAARAAFAQASGIALANGLLLALAVVPYDDFTALRALLPVDSAETSDPRMARLSASPEVFALAVPASARLSKQERRVLEELVRGGTLVEVAARLVLSPNTVKAHTRAVYRKLGVSERETMVAEAHRRGLV